MKITLTRAQLGEIEGQARRALPGEACGLIAGRFGGDGDATVTAIHASDNLAGENRAAPGERPAADRFEVDPGLHIRLQRRLRGTGAEILGVYHSHPEGPPAPSDYDARAAAYPGWVWLITAFSAAGGAGEEKPVTRAFLHQPGPDRLGGYSPAGSGSPATFAAISLEIRGR